MALWGRWPLSAPRLWALGGERAGPNRGRPEKAGALQLELFSVCERDDSGWSWAPGFFLSWSCSHYSAVLVLGSGSLVGTCRSLFYHTHVEMVSDL